MTLVPTSDVPLIGEWMGARGMKLGLEFIGGPMRGPPSKGFTVEKHS